MYDDEGGEGARLMGASRTGHRVGVAAVHSQTNTRVNAAPGGRQQGTGGSIWAGGDGGSGRQRKGRRGEGERRGREETGGEGGGRGSSSLPY